MLTQRSRDAIIVTWKMRHFRHFTSEHYKLSKSEVFEKVIPAANFRISADDMCRQEAQLSQRDRTTLCVIEYSAKSLKITQDHLK